MSDAQFPLIDFVPGHFNFTVRYTVNSSRLGATSLKVMPWSPQGLERISEWKRRIGIIPLVAIGGLTVERLPGVFAAGADVAAVVNDIVRNLDPMTRTREWLATASHPA